jgi:hypothetical protein
MLFESPCDWAKACSIAEADDPACGYYLRGLGWVNRVGSHAESVIADFERCVRLNPDYADKVRGYLLEAYRAVGRAPGI